MADISLDNPLLDGEDDDIEEKPDPALKAPELFTAVKNNDTAAAMEMLNEGVPPDYIDDTNYWTVINWAAKNGNVKVLKKLLECGGSASYHEYRNREKVVPLNAEEETEAEDPSEKQLLTNTPLMWAAYKGYPRMVWLLLIDGYSPDDCDPMGNNCLHLAASSGHAMILQSLVDDGANPFVLNAYKNRPIDVASNAACKEILTTAMERFASMDEESRKSMHAKNLNMYAEKVTALTESIAAAAKVESPRAFRSVVDIPAVLSNLSDVVEESARLGVDDDQIAEGRRLLRKLDRTQELMTSLSNVQRQVPINTQAKYIEHIQSLEKCVARAESVGVDRGHLQYGRDLIVRSQAEFLIFTALQRLKHVDCAVDANEQDMMKLKAVIQKGQALQACDDLVNEAVKRLQRLETELAMSRAILAVPAVKLPIEEPPADYWGEGDVGKITETEEYPLPPADNNGEYLWEHSAAYIKLANSIDRLRDSMDGAEGLGANPDVIKSASAKLAQVEKEMKLLDAKDAEDKRIAVEAAVKAAKKLKKGKKSKK
mmetsp:Transcript_23981/g.35196  ORF Transcript_23981/g.35196 Transcript_23981/m.35196 type:complete len:542 (-) Transcript_23981:143-1768(-)|eukprot:CAMPEP_0185034072 /NCGR_PEP_ID=MMETSP1103-20130426/23601_1 /TAXON_ID=36769 /ORGANISM="Paraphysomonas bandaiensis, Strain Caron Lab Isolate" /LENGTH=541 /DNA_ID=CAMNT_0027570575 /DNA_START=42 /DNA_END=1667 /DNA_ORIENTATION=+